MWLEILSLSLFFLFSVDFQPELERIQISVVFSDHLCLFHTKVNMVSPPSSPLTGDDLIRLIAGAWNLLFVQMFCFMISIFAVLVGV